MPTPTRLLRVAERIHVVLAGLLLRSVADPRLEGVTVTGVEVDREMAYATIFVAALESDERRQEILKGLQQARGFLRSELARRIPLRAFPRLRFRWDESPERGARIEAVLKQLREESDTREG